MLFALDIPANWEGPLAIIVWVGTAVGGSVYWYVAKLKRENNKVENEAATQSLSVDEKRTKLSEAAKDRAAKREQNYFDEALETYKEALRDERDASAKKQAEADARLDARDKQHTMAMQMIHADHTKCQIEVARLTERVAHLEWLAGLKRDSDDDSEPGLDRRDGTPGSNPSPS